MIIEVKKLKKTYEGKVPTHALKDVSFGIKKGEFVALMGRSGSGKSTLLHQLGLLDAPSSGEIIIDGINVVGFTEKQKTEFRLKKLGYVFQSYALLPDLSALESV
ncbi:MAG: ATP-binding cassette domain-containing protein, partial [Patescibacteria group bacterium]